MKQAYVNGEPIPREAVQFEFDRLVKFYVSHGMSQEDVKKNIEKLMERAQEQAIGAKLLLARAEQLDLPVDEKTIDAQVDGVIRQLGGRENYVKALAQQKMSEDDFRKELAKGCRVDALVQQACSGVPEPTEADVAAFYEANRTAFVASPQVLAQHILVKTEGMDAADKAQALEKIKSIRARVVAAGHGDPGETGQAFTAAAREHSDCPSAQNGGSLGWFGRGMMVPAFDQAAFAMACGEISDVVETQFGYHIILKTDEKPGGQQTLVDVADMIRDRLRHEARGRATEALVAELREKAKIEYR